MKRKGVDSVDTLIDFWPQRQSIISPWAAEIQNLGNWAGEPANFLAAPAPAPDFFGRRTYQQTSYEYFLQHAPRLDCTGEHYLSVPVRRDACYT